LPSTRYFFSAATRILSALRASGVNLLAYLGFSIGGGQSQIDLVPEDSNALKEAAERAGITLSEAKRAFLIRHHGEARGGEHQRHGRCGHRRRLGALRDDPVGGRRRLRERRRRATRVALPDGGAGRASDKSPAVARIRPLPKSIARTLSTVSTGSLTRVWFARRAPLDGALLAAPIWSSVPKEEAATMSLALEVTGLNCPGEAVPVLPVLCARRRRARLSLPRGLLE